MTGRSDGLVPAGRAEFAELLHQRAPAPYRLVSDSAIAPAEVLEMLAGLAETIAAEFEPSAWMIVEQGEVVGLLSLVRPYAAGQIEIGYGVAPSRQRRGVAGRAIAALIAWAREDGRIERVLAETGLDNLPSQRALVRNGFVQVGCRQDSEDGALLMWRAQLVGPNVVSGADRPDGASAIEGRLP